MNHILKSTRIFFSVIVISSVFYSCKDKDKDPSDPAPINPQELITTVKLILTDASDSNNTFTLQWKDADGPGALAPVIDTLLLDTSKTYNAVVSVLDETKSPVDDITKEIKEEAEAHQFFYTLSSNLSGRVSITRTDKDLNNLPVGLEIQLSTTAGTSVQGTMNVVLSHYDGVPKTASPSAESDIDITFPVRLK
ncbi:MAG: hypothetical protein KBB37_05955 [Bacteroidia bacterium]|nr:hypothetical protein [Bacteroidia bacterium]MBP7260813.1 hypothetical protein [Bacteroidia bacterium]MBP9180291.1 hypothetical protein [Bacteroidia bacterium]MBP9724649.1 hypothetical protein [Bacteroidia bacterium]